MTNAEREAILNDLGVDGLILAAYAVDDPRRIALLRIHHASQTVQQYLYSCASTLTHFLEEPFEYLADEALCEEVSGLASRLGALQAELLKSLPALSKRGEHRVEGTPAGLRGDAQAQPGESQERPGDRPTPDDWDDVPF